MKMYNASVSWIESDLQGNQTKKDKTVYGIMASSSEQARKLALAKIDPLLGAKVDAVWSEPEDE